MDGIGDVTMATAEYTLRALAQRADVRAHNLANINTPGFRAMRVDFQTNLRAALRDGELTGIDAPVLEPVPNLPGPNGNTVSAEGALIGQMKDNLLRSAMISAFNFKVAALRTAMGR